MNNDQPPVLKPLPADQAAMSVQELARAVLEQKLRPRVAGLRRLAEGVLALSAPAAKVKKPKKAKKPDKKKRKLAKIPGQI